LSERDSAAEAGRPPADGRPAAQPGAAGPETAAEPGAARPETAAEPGAAGPETDAEPGAAGPETDGPGARGAGRDSGFGVEPDEAGRPSPAKSALLAIVVDDVGYNPAQLRPFLELGIPFTFAVLPGLEYSTEAARMVADAGHELILHQPMEPLGNENPGPGAVYAGEPEVSIRATLRANAESVPGIVGVNNHMGSRATADLQTMRAVLSYLGESGLFYLDSRTTPDSTSSLVGAALGVPVLERNVFLDNVDESAAVSEQLEQAIELALDRGRAVAIGHAWSRSLSEVLAASLSEIRDAGVEFVLLSRLIGEL
jgi:hypothetical protein